jgi:aspartate-semialdehyde dehydrogenase
MNGPIPETVRDLVVRDTADVSAHCNRVPVIHGHTACVSVAVTVGRLRACNVFDMRFVGLHHNTVRGAAGGAILSAELLKERGFIK